MQDEGVFHALVGCECQFARGGDFDALASGGIAVRARGEMTDGELAESRRFDALVFFWGDDDSVECRVEHQLHFGFGTVGCSGELLGQVLFMMVPITKVWMMPSSE